MVECKAEKTELDVKIEEYHGEIAEEKRNRDRTQKDVTDVEMRIAKLAGDNVDWRKINKIGTSHEMRRHTQKKKMLKLKSAQLAAEYTTLSAFNAVLDMHNESLRELNEKVDEAGEKVVELNAEEKRLGEEVTILEDKNKQLEKDEEERKKTGGVTPGLEREKERLEKLLTAEREKLEAITVVKGKDACCPKLACNRSHTIHCAVGCNSYPPFLFSTRR